MEGAARNLAAEVPDDDFDKYLAAARKNWNRHLSRIEIECGNRDEKVKFLHGPLPLDAGSYHLCRCGRFLLRARQAGT